MPSLLYSLVRRRLGLQLEPALTDGLAHIVSQAAVSRLFLEGLLSGVQGVPSELFGADLRPQVSDRVTRPDLVGVADGRELLFIEGKLWAGLTEGQRGRYLDRLLAAHAASGTDSAFAGLLLFIAPTGRRRRLWSEIAKHLDLGEPQTGGPVLFAHKSGRHDPATAAEPLLVVGLCGWTEALAAAASALDEALEVGALSEALHGQLRTDLEQLRGLLDESEADAFRPMTIEETTDLDWPRRWVHLTTLPGDIAAAAAERDLLRLGGRHHWAGGNARKVFLNDWEFLLLCDAGRWADLHEGPLWLWRDGSYRLTPQVRRALGPGTDWGGRVDRQGGFCVPLSITPGATRDELIESAVKRLAAIGVALGPAPN